MKLDALIHFYQNISPDSLARFPEFYSDNAYFKDPFNEVRGMAAIQHIFTHMFEQVAEPRFIVVEQVVDASGAMLVWQFHFSVQLWGKAKAQVIHGASHLKFDIDGRINFHRDYWDTGEELYIKIPVFGAVFRGLRRAFGA